MCTVFIPVANSSEEPELSKQEKEQISIQEAGLVEGLLDPFRMAITVITNRSLFYGYQDRMGRRWSNGNVMYKVGLIGAIVGFLGIVGGAFGSGRKIE